MAKPALLVDAGALIALANIRDQYHDSVSRTLERFFGELVTTWPAVAEACHIRPEIYRTKSGQQLEILP
jgi:predicted nucleic acid-binding protein